MCNLYSETKGQAAIRGLFRTAHDRTGNLPAFPGIFPDQLAPIVRNGADGERELVMARWGMPGPPQFGGQPVTASVTSRVRTGAAGFRRGTAVSCPRPASASTKTRSPARPRHGSHFSEERPLFAFAGLGTRWRAVRGPKSTPIEGEHELFGFLTTEANALVAPIHPKAMPVILSKTEEFDLWLEGETIEALKLQRPLPDGMLEIVARGEKEDPPVEAVAS